MWPSRYFVLFVIYSVMGWIYETTFCTVKDRRWENRGFLFGPVCPIYGTGAVAISAVQNAYYGLGGRTMTPAEIFIIAFFGSMVLEYVTSYALEKLFHAVWWDYSNLPFNLHGRISLFTAMGFGFAGLLVIYIIVPFVTTYTDKVAAIPMELFALLFMAILTMDATLTVESLTAFSEYLTQAEELFNSKMERAVRKVHRPAIRRVRAFRYPKIDRERVESLVTYLKGIGRKDPSGKG